MDKIKHYIYIDGIEYWMNENSQFHRDDGGPAYIYSNGSERWYKNDYLHRENGPTVININGTEEWWKFE